MKLQLPNNVSRIWSNYKAILGTSFKGMMRADQEALLTKASVICTIGVTVLALGLFYSLIPSQIRTLLVPAAIFGAWWVGGKVVAKVIISRCESILNKENYQPEY